MKALEISGTVYAIGDVQVISPKFRKRELVVTIDGDGKYPQTVAFEATNDGCGELDLFEVGSNIEFGFYLRGREWTSAKGEIRYFNSLPIAFIHSAKEQPARAATPAKRETKPEPSPVDDSDVPF